MDRADYNGCSEELGDFVTSKMDESGLTIKDLARELGVTYEHARRLCKGYPQTGPVMKILAPILGLDINELETIVTRASINRRYPGFLESMTGVDPEIAPIARLWGKLSKDQKNDVVSLVKSMSRGKKG